MFGFPRVHAAPTRDSSRGTLRLEISPRRRPASRSMSAAPAPVPPGMTGKNLAETLARVASASTRAARARPARLVAVSKTKPVAQLMECYDAGHRDFGENYVQEILEKSPAMPADVNWRFIGHLQSNKVRPLIRGVPSLAVIETVDTVKLANRLDTQVAEAVADAIRAEPPALMVQVNTSGEESKSGVEPGAPVVDLAKHIAEECANLRFRGLMTIGMPDYTSRPENFEALRKCREEVCAALGVDPAEVELSMGMSGDFEAAIEMGSDSVRVGSSIFGARDYSKK